ncbi:MAG: AhpC/TSA family protein [Bacteroidales bacterium]|nr:AhpC/TSA family protein [Bacteroidales bacterium]
MNSNKNLKKFSIIKIRLLIVLAILFTTVSCVNKEKAVLRGKLENAKGKTLYLDEIDFYRAKVLDSLILGKNGKFSFGIHTKYPSFYQLRLSSNQAVNLLIKPDEKVMLTADAGNFRNTLEVTGSEGSRQIIQLNNDLEDTKHLLDSLKKVYASLPLSEENIARREILSKQYDTVYNRHYKYSIAFVLQYSSSMASIMALYQEISPGVYLFNRLRDLQFFKIVVDSLKKYYPESNNVKMLEGNFNNFYGQYQTSKLLRMADTVEFSVPKIVLPDAKGNAVNLSSYKGKVVLVSFWASWNKESIKDNLEMKQVYEKFRNKGFEIYQVSFDKSLDNWNRAVRFDELPWISVCDTTFPRSAVAARYNITQLPANFLINKEQDDILAKNVSALDLQKKLLRLLN